MKIVRTLVFLATLGSTVAGVAGREPGAPKENSAPTVVMLGDSITKGVRPGVEPSETFAAIVERELAAKGIAARVVNQGIGGERTDQALSRLNDVLRHRPRLVCVMYGTNDSYVDNGKKTSRLPLEDYRSNLRTIVKRLLLAGSEPILMTEPRWAGAARPNGLGENPNHRLANYVQACREVARECRLPLVDHFRDWSQAEKRGQDLDEWTTDGCHPNPRGHQQLAQNLLPVLLGALRSRTLPVDFQIELETVLEHDDGEFLWFHPRVAVLPDRGRNGGPAVLMTLQKHLRVSDYYSGLYVMESDDLGKSWSEPVAPAELEWVREPRGVNIAVADVTPGWHGPTGKVIAVGAQVRYNPSGEQLEDQPRVNQTAYAVFDPKNGAWSTWERLDMPAGEKFNYARSACAQWLVEPDGSVLLPFHIGPSASQPRSVTVARCRFDGRRLEYLEHGAEMSLDVARGLYEPSLVRFQDRYYLTIRNDAKGYVTVSDNGLDYRPIKAWTFDDGRELGSYNTQQHWLASRAGLFLVYTRRGAGNDHIIRHRAPLFIAQVDPDRLHVMRATERVLVPERGATLGNFGASAIDPGQSWVTVSEGVWNDEARRRGAKGALFLARVLWPEPAEGSATEE